MAGGAPRPRAPYHVQAGGSLVGVTLEEFDDLAQRLLRRLADDVHDDRDPPFVMVVASFPERPGDARGSSLEVTSVTGYRLFGPTTHETGEGHLVELAFPDPCWEAIGCHVNATERRCGRYLGHTSVHVGSDFVKIGQKRAFDDYDIAARTLVELAGCAAGHPPREHDLLETMRGRPLPRAVEDLPQFGVCRRCAVCLRWDIARGCCTVCGGQLTPTPNPAPRWKFEHCFSVPRDPGRGFDVLAGDHDLARGRLRDIRVVPGHDPTDAEGWTYWCAQGFVEADEMPDGAADELSWELFSEVAYGRVSDLMYQNEWETSSVKRQPAPRHPWGIPLERQRNTVQEGDIAQLKARLQNPWEYERQVSALEGLSLEDKAHLYAVMQALANTRAEVRRAEAGSDRTLVQMLRQRQEIIEGDLRELEESHGLDVGTVAV